MSRAGAGWFTLLVHFCLCISGVLQQSQLVGSGVNREQLQYTKSALGPHKLRDTLSLNLEGEGLRSPAPLTGLRWCYTCSPAAG